MNIEQWLDGLGLAQYAPAFLANDIDAALLPTLDDDDLRELGIASLGHRKRLLAAIAALAEHRPAPARAKPAGRQEAERRQLTLLFCDLVGSTALSARLDPEEMGTLIRGYHEVATARIEAWGGQVAKYLGDGVLAYFGWPQAREDDAERAVHAGLELVSAVAALTDPDGSQLAARVGIATGLVLVGEVIGHGSAQEESVVGETPNLAARLQALAVPGTVLIGQTTRRLLGDLFELSELGQHALKGFAVAQPVWRVERAGSDADRFSALHGARMAPLVGREHELGLLLDRLERARDGEGHVVLLSGEPGIGKSRLVQALREQLADSEFTVLGHYGSPYHRNRALHPIIGLLERAAGIDRAAPVAEQLACLEGLLAQGTESVAEVAPLIAALLTIPTAGHYPPLALPPVQQKERTLAALVEQLAGLARQQPVLALFEDAHWMDPTTLETLGLIIERVQRLPVLVIITYRPEFAPPWDRLPHVTTLSLTRLTRRHGSALVARVTGGKPLPGEIVELILEKTDGVPLFVEELTGAVLESGLLTAAGDRYTLRGPLPPLAIPSTLHDSLMARLDRISSVKEVAQTAAVIGREFTLDLLTELSDRPADEVRAALEQLEQAELVFRRGGGTRSDYSFKHALVQDTAYQSLLKSRRQELHARILDLLESRLPDLAASDPGLLAHHAGEAGFATRALDYWAAAGRQAVERSANAEAVNDLQRALELLATQPAGPARDRRELELLTLLGPALGVHQGFGSRECESLYLRARELAQGQDPRHRFTIAWGQWNVYQNLGRFDEATGLIEELLEIAAQSGDPAHRLQAHHSGWTTELVRERLPEAREHVLQGLALYDFAQHRDHAFLYGGHDPGVCCRMVGGLVHWLLGWPDTALRLAAEGVSLGQRLGHPNSLALAYSFLGSVHKLRREPELAMAAATEFAQVASAAELAPAASAHYVATAQLLVGWARCLLGEAAQGLAQLHEGMRVMRGAGWSRRRLTYQFSLLAEGLLVTGDRDAGLAVVEEALHTARQTGEHLWDAELLRLRGELLADGSEGDTAAAMQAFRDALAAARRLGARGLELRAALALGRHLHRVQGHAAESRGVLVPLLDSFTEGESTGDLHEARALLAQAG